MDYFLLSENLKNLNPEFFSIMRQYMDEYELRYYDVIVLFGGEEHFVNHDIKSFTFNEKYRIALYEFFKENEEKLPMWIELLKLKML